MRFERALALIILLLGLVPFLGYPLGNGVLQTECLNTSDAAADCGHISSETITRREALLRYVTALYCQGGYFHHSVDAPPLEGKLGLYPSATDIHDGYSVMSTLNATGTIDWAPSISLLKSLVNGPSSSEDLSGLINSTAMYPPNLLVESNSVDLFYALGVGDELDLDTIAAFVAEHQMTSGGFISCATDPNPPGLISTYFGIRFLTMYGYTHLLDIDRAADFILECRNSDGGFGETVGQESIFGVLPLALMTLDLIDREFLIEENLTLSYLLGQWDNETGCHIEGEIVSTERAIWCFSLLSAIDLIDTQAAVRWILDCQSHEEGAFRVYPGDDSDRLYFCHCAVHTLSLLDRLETLDSLFTVSKTPEWQVPQWYLDKIASETTPVPGPYVWIFPDLSGLFYSLWPVVPILLFMAPAIYWVANDRKQRARLRAARKNRGPR